MQKSASFIITIATLSLTTGVLAHSGATGVVKERMELMDEVAKSTKIIANMITGKATLDPALAATASNSLENHASEMLSLFPKGSLEGPSEARPEIWEDWETFSGLAFKMQMAAKNIAADTSNVDAMKPGFASLAKTCGACHEKFRLKK